MATIKNEQHTFEVVDCIPKGYRIWNIGTNMTAGYLPLAQIGSDCRVNTNTLKALKFERSEIILEALCRGQDTVPKMQKYIKRYERSESAVTQNHIQKLIKALEIMPLIKWEQPTEA